MHKMSILIVLSLLALFYHEYKFAVSDQEIFIPFILQWKDPNLFQNDLLFDQFSSETSLFYPLFGILAKFIDIQTLFFISFFLLQFFFSLAIYHLSFVLLKNKQLAYFSVPIFFLPKFIGGTATFTFDDFFGYRSIGVIFLLFYLSHLLEGKFAKSMIFATLSFLFHPLSIIPNCFLFIALYVKNQFKFPLKKIAVIFFIFGAVPIAIAVILPKNQLWLDIIRSRDDYLFLSEWGIRGWLSFFLYLSLIIFFLKEIKGSVKRNILLVIIVCYSVFVGNYIAFELLKTPDLAKFQLYRSIVPVGYISLCLSPLFLVNKDTLGKFLGILCFITLSLNLFEAFLITFIFFVIFNYFTKRNSNFVFNKSLYFVIPAIVVLEVFLNLSNHKEETQKIQFPKQANDWINAQNWAKENTTKESVFLVPPNETGFRIFSNRPIVGDIKDGAVVIYDKSYAQRWYALMTDLAKYNAYDDRKFTELASIYNFDFIVTSSNHQLKFETVYKNKSFVIYKI